MSVKFNTGVHFRNKDGSFDDSYLTEQVLLNKDYKDLEDKPIQYLTDDTDITELDSGIYQVFTNGTSIVLSNNSNETVEVPDRSVLFAINVYNDIVKVQLITDGNSYIIDSNTLLETELENAKLATMNEAGKPHWDDLDGIEGVVVGDVTFVTCLKATWLEIDPHNNDTLYFIKDTGEIYKGDVLYSGGGSSNLVGDNETIEIDDDTIKAIVSNGDFVLDLLNEEGLVSPIGSNFIEDGQSVEKVLQFADGSIMTY